MAIPLEERTARLTILIDPRKKSLFERLCAQEDATPSQVVRRLIRRYIEEQTGAAQSAAPALHGATRVGDSCLAGDQSVAVRKHGEKWEGIHQVRLNFERAMQCLVRGRVLSICNQPSAGRVFGYSLYAGE
jgi:hypothetical protein